MTTQEQRRVMRRRIGGGWLRNNLAPAPGHDDAAVQSELPLLPDSRPTLIVTDTHAEFFALCEREKTGELRIESITVGAHNAQWVCRVKYL